MDIVTLNFVYYFLIFVSGCLIGSFLKLVSDRIVKNQSIIFGRSKCDFCNKSLNPKDLVPVLSYLFYKGKCSYCKKDFSPSYPMAELITGLLFLGASIYVNLLNNFNLYSLVYFIFLITIFSLYVVMTFSDISYYIMI